MQENFEFSFHPRPGRGWKLATQDLEGGYVRCLQALGTLGNIEFNRLPLGE